MVTGENRINTFRVDTSNLHTEAVATELLRTGFGTPHLDITNPLEHLEQLNEYARRFGKRLFDAHPEFRPAARVSQDFRALFVDIAAPAPHAHELWIRTEEDEVTVGFGQYFHTHFQSWDAASESKSFDQALQFIGDLIAERVLIAVAMRGEDWTGSWVERSGEPLEGNARPKLAESPGVRVSRYSWRAATNE